MPSNISADIYWYSLKNPKPSEGFFGELKTDVVVVGGGVAGLSCAQKLHEAGRTVVLLEKNFCGSGASGKSAGILTPDSEIELSELIKTYGEKKAKSIWNFSMSGIESICKNIEDHNISCDFQKQDSLYVANNASSFKYIKKEYEANMKLGYETMLYDKTKVKEVIGSESYAGAVRYSGSFSINAYMYCQGMKDVLNNSGVKIFEQTQVKHIKGNEISTVGGGHITANNIIVCTDGFLPNSGALKDEVYQIQTFLGITKPLTDETIKKIFPNDSLIVWDTDLIYNYFRLTGDKRLVIGGGDLMYTYTKKSKTHTKRFEKQFKNYMKNKFPSASLEIEYVWSGTLGVSKDLLPIAGTSKDNPSVFYVGAATGLSWASALGSYAAEHLLNNRNEFDKDFSPDRRFIIGGLLQSLLSTPATYALSHGIKKYL